MLYTTYRNIGAYAHDQQSAYHKLSGKSDFTNLVSELGRVDSSIRIGYTVFLVSSFVLQSIRDLEIAAFSPNVQDET